MRKITLAAAAATAVFSVAAYAAVIFDPVTSTGFVGKGDVQYTLGLNNAGIQALGTPAFTYTTTTVTEAEWTCDKDAGPQTQERSRTTTTSVQGIVAATARLKNQITGYNLNGPSGIPNTSSETEGPALGSCPTNWTSLGVTETTSTLPGGGLAVNGTPLISPPVL